MKKHRIYKKLCKKAAQTMGFKNCDVEDGIHYTAWHCGGYDDEYDSEDCWPYLVECFENEVNTTVNSYSDFGIDWKHDNQSLKATPKNVFAWARNKVNFCRI